MPRKLLYRTYEVRSTFDANGTLPSSRYPGPRIQEDSVFVSDFQTACDMAKTHTPRYRPNSIKGEVIGESGRVLRRYT